MGDKQINLLADPLIAQYCGETLRNARLMAIESIVTCYQTVKLEFLANKVDVDVPEIRSLLAELILEERIQGKID